MTAQNPHLEYQYHKNHPLKTLYILFKPDRYKLLLSLIFFTAKHSPVWILPLVISRMINIASKPDIYTLNDLWLVGAIFFVLILQNIPGHMLFIKYFSGSIYNMQRHLRYTLVRRLQELSITFHDSIQSGRLQAKVLRDVEMIEGLTRHLMNGIFPAVLSIIVALIITLQKEPLIALFYFLTVPVSSALVKLFSKKMTSKNMEYRTEVELMSARVSEMIQMIPVTRAHGLEQVEINKVDKHLENVKKKGIRLDILGAIFGASSWSSFQIFQLICLLFSTYLAYKKIISIGDVVLYQSFFSMIVGSVNSILNVYPEMSRGFESIKSIGEILECPDVELNEGKLPVPVVKGEIRFENIAFLYKNSHKPAVGDFSLNIKSGESIAFVGESGSGKSTIMSLVIGFRRPTTGTVFLDSIDMNKLDLRQYRRFLSVVPQNVLLFNGSVRENIVYGLENISDKDIWNTLELANAVDFVKDLPDGINTIIGENGAKLSGGQRQRIAIARAFMRDPRIVILDEATSALDVLSESLIQEALTRLLRNRTTLIVAHRLSTIRSADRIVVMKGGKCVEIGTHNELMQKEGEYFNLKRLQS